MKKNKSYCMYCIHRKRRYVGSGLTMYASLMWTCVRPIRAKWTNEYTGIVIDKFDSIDPAFTKNVNGNCKHYRKEYRWWKWRSWI